MTANVRNLCTTKRLCALIFFKFRVLLCIGSEILYCYCHSEAGSSALSAKQQQHYHRYSTAQPSSLLTTASSVRGSPVRRSNSRAGLTPSTASRYCCSIYCTYLL